MRAAPWSCPDVGLGVQRVGHLCTLDISSSFIYFCTNQMWILIRNKGKYFFGFPSYLEL